MPYAGELCELHPLWTARLHGISARAYHPVIAGNTVMFTTQPGLGKFGAVNVLIEACRKLDLQQRRRIGADPLGPEETRDQIRAKDEHNRPLLLDADILRRQLEGVREIHRQRPETRTFFAFDKNTGKEPWIAPICWEESCGGPGNPPVVMPEGRVIVKYALFTQARYDQYARYIRAGYLDLKTGDLTPLLDPFDAAKGRPFGLVHDEMSRLTGSGSVLIAYARLARRFGDAEAEKQAVDAAVSLLRARVEAERTYTKTHFHQRLLLRTQPSRYLFLSPELGHLVRDHTMDAATELYLRYIEHLRPMWYLAWGPLSYDAWETSIDRPNNSWAVFCARAMIFNDDSANLLRFLDIPWCKADLYYIQKLALAISQASAAEQDAGSSTRSTRPAQSPR